MNCGRLTHAVELVTRVAVGLPTRGARFPVMEFHRLVDEGALLVMGPGIKRTTWWFSVNTSRCERRLRSASSERRSSMANTASPCPTAGTARKRRSSPTTSRAGAPSHRTLRRAWRHWRHRIPLVVRRPGPHARRPRRVEHVLERRPADGELDSILRDVRDRVAPDVLVYMGTGWTTPAFDPASIASAGTRRVCAMPLSCGRRTTRRGCADSRAGPASTSSPGPTARTPTRTTTGCSTDSRLVSAVASTTWRLPSRYDGPSQPRRS